jgi:hypothetical protein
MMEMFAVASVVFQELAFQVSSSPHAGVPPSLSHQPGHVIQWYGRLGHREFQLRNVNSLRQMRREYLWAELQKHSSTHIAYFSYCAFEVGGK